MPLRTRLFVLKNICVVNACCMAAVAGVTKSRDLWLFTGNLLVLALVIKYLEWRNES